MPTLADTEPVQEPRNANHERLRGLFGTGDQFFASLSPETATRVRSRLEGTPDDGAMRQRLANTAFLADRLKLPAAEVAARYDTLRTSYARQMFPERMAADGTMDDGVFFTNAGRLLTEEAQRATDMQGWNATLFEHAAKGASFDQAFAAIRATGTIPSDKRRLDIVNAWAIDRWEKNRTQATKLAPMIATLAEHLAGFRSGERPGAQAYNALIDDLATLDREEQSVVLRIASEQAMQTPQKERGAVRAGVETLLQGGTDTITAALSGLYATTEAIAGHTEEEKRRQARFQTERLVQSVATGEVDPIKGDSFAGQVALDFTRGVPAMLAALTPAGLAVDYFAFKQQAKERLQAQGVDDVSAEGTAMLQAVPQTALFFVSSKMVFLGKVPKFAMPQQWTAGGIAASVGKVAAVEYGANLALNEAGMLTDAGIQQMMATLSGTMPGVDWQQFGKDFVGAQPQQLALAIPGALIGTGVATFRNTKAGMRYLQQAGLMEDLGYTPEAKAAVMAAPDYATADKAFKDGFETRAPAAPVPDVGLPTLESLGTTRNEDGTYRVQADPAQPAATAATSEGAAMVADQQRTEAAQKAATAPPEPHPEADGRVLPPRVTALNKAEIEALRLIFNLDELDAPTRERFVQVLDEAKRTNAHTSADAIAQDLIATGRVSSAAEHAALVLRSAELQNQYENVAAQIGDAYAAGDTTRAAGLRRTADNLQTQLDAITEASDLTGTAIARALSIRRMRVNRDDYSLAKTIQRAKAVKQGELTPEQQATIDRYVKQLDEQKAIIEAQKKRNAELEVDLARKNAETFVAEGRARRRAATAEDAATRRKALKGELLKLGMRVNDITSIIGNNVELARLVAKIADTYIEEGVASLQELTNKLKADLPDLSDQDIFQAVGRQTKKEAAKIETEAKRRVKELRTQAALWAKINAALDGKRVDGSPMNREQRNKLLRESLNELRRQANKTTFDDAALKRVDAQIAELQKHLAAGTRPAPVPRPEGNEQLNAAKETLKQLRQEMGAQDTLAELERMVGEEGEAAKTAVKPVGENLAKLREQIADVRKQMREAKKQPKSEPDSPEQRAAQSELNTLAKRYSDTQAWPKPKENAVLDAIKAQRASPMPRDEFAATLEAFGVDAPTVNALAGAMEIEARARETARGLADVERTQKLEATLADLEEQLQTGQFKEPAERAKDTNERRNELRKHIAALRDQIEQAQVDPAAVNAERLAKLNKLAADLEAQLEGGFRTIPEPKTGGVADSAMVEAARRQVRELERLMRTTDAIADLEEQLRTGDFKVSAPEQRILSNARLEQALIRQRQLRREVDEAIERMRKRTGFENVVEGLLIPRTLLATADMSAMLRQGLLLSVSRPVTAARAFAASLKSVFSENTFDAIQSAIETRPLAMEGARARLFLSEAGGSIRAREEHFLSNFVERIPVVRQIVKASNRSMVTTLNMLRVAAFDSFVKAHPDATIEQKRAYAAYVNAASGRGNVKWSPSTVKTLNAAFFAPRYAVSRFQALASPFKNFRDPIVRNAILRDFGAFLGTGLSVLALASWAGAEVTLDPSDSDFGKIVVDDTRIDIWGGLQQPARLILQAALALPQRAGAMDLENEIDPIEAALNFTKYKLSPAVTVPIALVTGENIIGKEQDWDETLLRSITPLSIQETIDVFANTEEADRAAAAGALSFFGVGVQEHSRN